MPPELFPQMPDELGAQTPEQLTGLISQFEAAIVSVVTGEAFASMETPPNRNEVRSQCPSGRFLKSVSI